MTDKTKKTKKTEKTKKVKKPRPSKVIRKLVEIIDTEQIDDLPLLWAQLQAMGVIRLFDKHFPQHSNWEGELSAIAFKKNEPRRNVTASKEEERPGRSSFFSSFSSFLRGDNLFLEI